MMKFWQCLEKEGFLMPISQIILNKIVSSNVDDKQKDLMRQLLDIEDAGIYQYKSEYKKLLKSYIANEDHRENGHSD